MVSNAHFVKIFHNKNGNFNFNFNYDFNFNFDYLLDELIL